jgi:putative ABC transport system permease protein
MRWTHGLRARLGLLRRGAVEERMDEEIRFHIEMETEKNLRAGMSPEEARRQAAIAFGGVEGHREALREGRPFGWLGGLSLDARLGGRMLVKHPGLTLVASLGLAVAIAIAAIVDASVGAAYAPLPIPGGDRIVALEVWDAELNNQEGQLLHDYGVWRQELRTIEALGLHRTTMRNLVVPGGSSEPVFLAEMTATGFGIVGVPPLLGRPLLEADEIEGAPAVVVLGHDLWQSRFGGDPGVVGREVRVGNATHTVVGVMPERFGFPLNHLLWVPFGLDPAAYAPREGPTVHAFGRLAPGVPIGAAQAELTAIGNRLAADFPDTHRHLRPRVIQYGPHLMADFSGWEIPMMRAIITLLLVLIAVNVSVLVYARTATRAGEIAVRSALGASRRRIVTQFLVEGLALAGISALAGLAAAHFVLRRLETWIDAALAPMGGLPFWLDFHLSARAFLFAVVLAVLAAAIVGVLPALRATGSRLQPALRTLGGATGMRLGRTWSLLIVAQVAFTVAILPAATHWSVLFARFGLRSPGFPVEEYLTTELVLDREAAGGAAGETAADREAGYAARLTELSQRLESEAEVLGVTFALSIPTDERMVGFAVEGAPMPGASGSIPAHRVKYNRVDRAFFETFELPVISGRDFEPGDRNPAAATVVVNRAFVRDVLGGEDPLGRRIRFVEGYRSGGIRRVPDGLELDREYEVVGVVPDLPPREMNDPDDPVARVYRLLAPEDAYPLNLTIRTRGSPTAFAPRLRELVAAVDPDLQPRVLQPLEAVLRRSQAGFRLGALGLGLLTGSVLLLSAAGIYAMMSFTVTRRRREIGIRSALGARPRRLVAGIFSRAALQLGAGAGAGLLAAVALNLLSGGELMGGGEWTAIIAVVAIVVTVGLLAAAGPARRALRIEPLEALKAE